MMPSSRPEEVIGSLITLGDELLQGDILNGNARHIAQSLRDKGFRLTRVLTVGDREEDIVGALNLCMNDSRFLIVTGGLGPTDDDRTNAAVSQAFGRELVADPRYTEWLKARLAERGRPWSREVARMTELPVGAVKLGKEMAGFAMEQCGIPCYFLPGVPREMEILMAELVVPDLERRFPRRAVYVKHILRIQELFEAEINQRLGGLDGDRWGVELGSYPQGTEIWLTILAVAESEEEARNRIAVAISEIVALLGARYVSSEEGEGLEVVLGRLLRKRGWRLAAAESCTGGLLAKRITSISGSSDYFDRAFITYSNTAKTELLKVPEELLEAHGAVSEPVADAMARGALQEAGVDVAVAVTGIAGPTGGTPGKPVGTVFMACATSERCVVEKHHFRGSREGIRERAAQAALTLLWRVLTDDPIVCGC